jgi:hypothetical protein
MISRLNLRRTLMNPRENVSNAVSALQGAAESIRRIENEAREALFIRDDPETHRQKLQEKRCF